MKDFNITTPIYGSHTYKVCKDIRGRNKEVIILCGGLATRFKPITEKIPKCLVEIEGKPILHYQLEWLRAQGYNHIILAVGHMHEEIIKWVEGRRKELNLDSMTIDFSIEYEQLGTGGAIKQASEKISSDEFLVINGDNITTMSVSHLERKGPNCLALVEIPFRFGIVDILDDGRLSFKEKPRMLVNSGIYYINKSLCKKLPDKGSFEREVLPNIELKAYIFNDMWKTFDKEDDLKL